MFNTDRKYKIHWEITDLCNLKCPMCPRTDISNHCRPVKEIQNSQFLLDDVKKYFPDSFLKKVKRIDFCGNFGDPCIARDFYDICEFLVKDYGITIMASTNGSMRNPAWWKKLGELLAGTKSWFDFHIDGLRDTNHLYRIGANWDKVMANAEAFISGGARADWHFILFKHNQHQVDQAHDIAHKMGFKHFVPTDSGRFPEGGKFRYMHPDGDFRDLEQATITVQNGIRDAKSTDIIEENTINPDEKPNRKTIKSFAAQGSVQPQNMEMGSAKAVNGINCKSQSRNRFFLDSFGCITPCCWVTNRDIEKPGDMLKSLSFAGKDLANYNIRNRPIEEILADELFTDVFPDLWKSDALATCRKKCGKHHRNFMFKISL
jgi:MoaA/NifB/PqqE/SkfB family radical SAM enzyme